MQSLVRSVSCATRSFSRLSTRQYSSCIKSWDVPSDFIQANNIVKFGHFNDIFFQRSPALFTPMSDLELPQINGLIEIIEAPFNGRNDPLMAIKRTYQPSVLKRKRTHGFLKRKSSVSGRRILLNRLKKKRWRLSP